MCIEGLICISLKKRFFCDPCAVNNFREPAVKGIMLSGGYGQFAIRLAICNYAGRDSTGTLIRVEVQYIRLGRPMSIHRLIAVGRDDRLIRHPLAIELGCIPAAEIVIIPSRDGQFSNSLSVEHHFERLLYATAIGVKEQFAGGQITLIVLRRDSFDSTAHEFDHTSVANITAD